MQSHPLSGKAPARLEARPGFNSLEAHHVSAPTRRHANRAGELAMTEPTSTKKMIGFRCDAACRQFDCHSSRRQASAFQFHQQRFKLPAHARQKRPAYAPSACWDREPKSALWRPQPATETAGLPSEPAKMPANCRLFGRDQEQPVGIELRGGLERTRTACQARSPFALTTGDCTRAAP